MKILMDSAFPSLATALNPEEILGEFRRALPVRVEGRELTEVQIFDVHYRPQQICRILYQLKFRKAGAGRSTRQLLAAVLLKEGDRLPAIPADLPDRFQAKGKSVIKDPVVHLPHLGMVAYSYPFDPSLPDLIDALDARFVKDALSRSWAPEDQKVRKVKVRLLGYTPNQRATFLYDVQTESRIDGSRHSQGLVGKMSALGNAAATYAQTWALWQAASGMPNLAPPAGFIGSLKLSLQGQVSGERLGGLVTHPDLNVYVKETAKQIAALHNLSLPLSATRTFQHSAGVVNRWSDLLMGLRPDLDSRIVRLKNWLLPALEESVQVTGPIHGDFHHTNILAGEKGVTLIDLDSLCYGDRLVDVGRLMASLRIPSLRAFGDVQALNETIEIFLETYLELIPETQSRVRLFEAAALLIAAGSSFRIQRPGWEEHTAMLLEESERVLALSRAPTEPRCTSMPVALDCAVVQQTKWAQDEKYMQVTLAPVISKHYGKEEIQCEMSSFLDKDSRYQVGYRCSSGKGPDRWEVTMEGSGGEATSPSQFKHLQSLNAAHQKLAGVPLMPNALEFLAPLGLLVWEKPKGTSFASLVGSKQETPAIKALVRAVQLIHQTPLDLKRKRTLHEEVLDVQRRIENLRQVSPEFLSGARELGSNLAAQSANLTPAFATTVSGLHPQHISWHQGRIVLAKLGSITCSDPSTDLGNFLARLHCIGARRGTLSEASYAAGSIRQEYLDLDETRRDSLGVSEALALLRLAGTYAKQQPALANLLLESSSALVEQG